MGQESLWNRFRTIFNVRLWCHNGWVGGLYCQDLQVSNIGFMEVTFDRYGFVESTPIKSIIWL